MKKLLFTCLLLSFLSCAVHKQTGASGWIELFNGKDLNDWIIKIKDHPLNDNWGNTFRVEDGVLKVRYDAY